MKKKTKPVSTAKKSVQGFDDTVISAALDKYLDLAWTAEKQKIIRNEVGASNYARIEEILAFVSNQDAWLNASNLSSAADVVSGKLSQHYTGLSAVAVFKIISQATYGWR